MSLPNVTSLEIRQDEIQQEYKDKTLLWDFDEGDFVLIDGKTVEVEGIEYLKVWIKKALLTVRNTLVYKDTEYGSEHYNLIGTSFKPSFTEQELKRMILEALDKNPFIQRVDNFKITKLGARSNVEFEVISDFGRVYEEVSV